MSDWLRMPLDQFVTSNATDAGAAEVMSSLPPPPSPSRRPAPTRDESDWALPHHATFAAVWNKGFRTHYWRFDEALRKSIVDAAAMRRDPLIHASLRRRQIPVTSLPIVVEPDNPRDPGQRAAAQRAQQLLEATPYFPWLKMALLEAIFYGKAGAELVWGVKRIDGLKSICVKDHIPIHGDKILWKWNRTPGILMNQGEIADLRPQVRANIEETTGTYGPALFLRTRDLRKRFIIHRFEPTDQDYWLESDMAAAAMGLGLRSRLWFPWNTRNEVLSWALDAIQRVGANGGLAGFYPHGNDAAKAATRDALVNLVRDHIGLFPYIEGNGDPKNLIKDIPVNATGYDVLKVFTDYFDMLMREIILGESGPGSPINTRLAAELVEEGRFSVQRADANALAETLTTDLLEPLVEFNHDQLASIAMRQEIDFGLKVKLQLEKPNSIEDLQAAQLLIGIIQADAQLRASGVEVPLDITSLVDKSGLLPPEGQEQQQPPQAMPGPLPDNPTGPAGFEGQPRVKTERPTRNEGGDPSRYSSSVSRERYMIYDTMPASAVKGEPKQGPSLAPPKPLGRIQPPSGGIPEKPIAPIRSRPPVQPPPVAPLAPPATSGKGSGSVAPAASPAPSLVEVAEKARAERAEPQAPGKGRTIRIPKPPEGMREWHADLDERFRFAPPGERREAFLKGLEERGWRKPAAEPPKPAAQPGTRSGLDEEDDEEEDDGVVQAAFDRNVRRQPPPVSQPAPPPPPRKAPESFKDIPRSEGHRAFVGDTEFFVLGTKRGVPQLYSAPISSPIGEGGRRAEGLVRVGTERTLDREIDRTVGRFAIDSLGDQAPVDRSDTEAMARWREAKAAVPILKSDSMLPVGIAVGPRPAQAPKPERKPRPNSIDDPVGYSERQAATQRKHAKHYESVGNEDLAAAHAKSAAMYQEYADRARREHPGEEKNLLGHTEFKSGPSSQGGLFGKEPPPVEERPSGSKLDKEIEAENKARRHESLPGQIKMFGGHPEPPHAQAPPSPADPALKRRLTGEYFAANERLSRARRDSLDQENRALEAEEAGDRAMAASLRESAASLRSQVGDLERSANEALSRLEALEAPPAPRESAEPQQQPERPESFPGEHATWGDPESDADEPPNLLASENDVVPGWERKAPLPTAEEPAEIWIAPKRASGKKGGGESYRAYANDPEGNSIRMEKYNGKGTYNVVSVGPGSMPTCECQNFHSEKLGDNRDRIVRLGHTCKHIDAAIESGWIPPITQDRLKRASSPEGKREFLDWVKKTSPGSVNLDSIRDIARELGDA